MLPMSEMVRKYSTWAVGAMMAAVAYWFTLSPAEQAALQQAYPWLGKVTPAAGFLMFYFARAKAQDPPAPPSDDGDAK
jgi:hypothetical protein